MKMTCHPMQKCQLNGPDGGSMADKLGLGREVRELKLGPSFSNKGTAFHTIRYDFKPASVDLSKMATVDMGQFGSVTVTVPHLDGAGTPHTVFRGNRKEYTKECVLIIDRNTGEITLEKLSYNIQVKKTRLENAHKLAPPASGVDSGGGTGGGIGKRSPHQKGGSTSHHSAPNPPLTVPRHSPLHASPSRRSPPSSSSASQSSVPPSRSPPPNKRTSPSHNIPTLSTVASLSPANQKSPVPASLPIIGSDEPLPASQEISLKNDVDSAKEMPPVGVLSDSSSDSNSSSDSGSSDSESETDHSRIPGMPLNGHMNGMTRMCSPLPGTNSNSSISTSLSNSLQQHEHLLNEDLQLSESGSDSD